MSMEFNAGQMGDELDPSFWIEEPHNVFQTPPPPPNANANANAGTVRENARRIHRDVERQRRDEMAACLASLRSLIPHHYLKGKRSMCDQLQEATNYIAHQKRKNQELRETRDMLRGVPTVDVRSCGDGMEVMIGGSRDGEVGVSDVVVVLEESGIEVTSCVSTCTRDCSFHCLRCEVNDTQDDKVGEVQEKLRHLFRHL